MKKSNRSKSSNSTIILLTQPDSGAVSINIREGKGCKNIIDSGESNKNYDYNRASLNNDKYDKIKNSKFPKNISQLFTKDINSFNKDNLAPIHLAILNGWVENNISTLKKNYPFGLGILDLASNPDCDLNLRTNTPDGWTPLFWSCQIGNTHLLKILLKYKERIDLNLLSRGSRPLLPVEIAIMNKNNECLKMLIDAGAIIDKRINPSFTPIYAAIEIGNKIAFDQIAKRIDIKLPCLKDLYSPLYISVLLKKKYFVMECLKYGALPSDIIMNYSRKKGRFKSPINVACFYDNVEILKILNKDSNYTNSMSSNGKTNLYICSENNSARCIKQLFKYDNIEPNVTYNNYTPLAISIVLDKYDSFKAILFENEIKIRENIFLGRIQKVPSILDLVNFSPEPKYLTLFNKYLKIKNQSDKVSKYSHQQHKSSNSSSGKYMQIQIPLIDHDQYHIYKEKIKKNSLNFVSFMSNDIKDGIKNYINSLQYLIYTKSPDVTLDIRNIFYYLTREFNTFNLYLAGFQFSSSKDRKRLYDVIFGMAMHFVSKVKNEKIDIDIMNKINLKYNNNQLAAFLKNDRINLQEILSFRLILSQCLIHYTHCIFIDKLLM